MAFQPRLMELRIVEAHIWLVNSVRCNSEIMVDYIMNGRIVVLL